MKRRSRGLSLLETLLAMLILTLCLWSFQTLYVGLLRGTSKSDLRRAAVSAAETVFVIWEQRAKETWPVDPPGEAEAYTVEGLYPDVPSDGEVAQYLYRVEVGGRVSNPLFNSSSPPEDEYLNMRPVKISLEFEDKGTQKVEVKGSVSL